MRIQGYVVLAALLATPLTAAAEPSVNERLERMLSGRSAMEGKELAEAVRKADASPLGSPENPVRVSLPAGERAYLAQLRCSDGAAPKFDRAGNVGAGVFGNIVDLYIVECTAGEPRSSRIHMDMYHRGHVETRTVPGFTLATDDGSGQASQDMI